MVNEHYSIALPLDQTQWLKVTVRVLEKQPGSQDSSTQHSFNTDIHSNKGEVALSSINELPGNIIQAIRASHKDFLNDSAVQQSFMASTATGFQLLRLNLIVCFEYQTKRKQWEVLLYDQTRLPLKRNTIASTILNYSKNFIQINPQHIINLDYLVRIEGRNCELSIPWFGNENKLIISRSYMKALEERVEVI